MSIPLTFIAIEKVYASWEQNGDKIYSRNEMATRYALIDPVLRSLGWDTEDSSMVRVHDRLKNGKRPDYTLFKNGDQVAFVEAKYWWKISTLKKLSNITVDKVFSQLETYRKPNNIHIGVLTDGGAWWVFDFTNKKTSRNPLRIDFGDGNFREAARQFQQISRRKL